MAATSTFVSINFLMYWSVLKAKLLDKTAEGFKSAVSGCTEVSATSAVSLISSFTVDSSASAFLSAVADTEGFFSSSTIG